MIAPGKSILDHIHDPQLEIHEVIAGKGTNLSVPQEAQPYIAPPEIMDIGFDKILFTKL